MSRLRGSRLIALGLIGLAPALAGAEGDGCGGSTPGAGGSPMMGGAAGTGARSSGGTAGDAGGAAGATSGEGGSGLAGAGGAGDAGAAGAGDAGAAGAPGEPEPEPIVGCKGGYGPTMVDRGGIYCIDSTEVTNAQYVKFLAAAVDPATQPESCQQNDSFTPRSGWPVPAGRSQHPVVNVDWCDAAAFCAWAGKRLCGAIGGGPNPVDLWSDHNSGQWLNACSASGTKPWPYGAPYDPVACNGIDQGIGDTLPVASLPLCQGGTAGIFDMSGNVEEWVDSCQGDLGALDTCMVMGGSYSDEGEFFLRCSGGGGRLVERWDSSERLGFRCCRDLE